MGGRHFREFLGQGQTFSCTDFRALVALAWWHTGKPDLATRYRRTGRGSLCAGALTGALLLAGAFPEGTRKRIPGWRSGFYQTALRAGVPLGLVRLDYGRCEVLAQDFISLSGNETEDFKRIAGAYDGVRACIPENAAPICPLDPAVPRAETIVK